MVNALDYLQQHNIAHRDVRSDNLLLNSHGFLKLSESVFLIIRHAMLMLIQLISLMLYKLQESTRCVQMRLEWYSGRQVVLFILVLSIQSLYRPPQAPEMRT